MRSDDELDSLSLGSRDGAELLHMRSSGREETKSDSCIQAVWDRQLERVYHEHLAGGYDYGVIYVLLHGPRGLLVRKRSDVGWLPTHRVLFIVLQACLAI